MTFLRRIWSYVRGLFTGAASLDAPAPAGVEADEDTRDTSQDDTLIAPPPMTLELELDEDEDYPGIPLPLTTAADLSDHYLPGICPSPGAPPSAPIHRSVARPEEVAEIDESVSEGEPGAPFP